MNKATILIRNWEKHQGRSDYKCQWWKLSNEFFQDPEITALPLEAKTVFLYVCCAASKQHKPNPTLVETEISVYLGLNWDDFLQAIEIIGADRFTIESVRNPFETRSVDKIRKDKIRKEYAPNDEKKPCSTDLRSAQESVSALLDWCNLKSNEKWFKELSLLAGTNGRLIDVIQTMPLWLQTNPSRRPKTTSGMKRFVNGWVKRGLDSYVVASPQKLDPKDAVLSFEEYKRRQEEANEANRAQIAQETPLIASFNPAEEFE